MAHHPSPVPTLPGCCPEHRLGALDAIDALLFNDTLASFDRMVAAGLTASQAADCLRHDYRQWILSRLGEAVDDACTWVDMEVAT